MLYHLFSFPPGCSLQRAETLYRYWRYIVKMQQNLTYLGPKMW